MSKALLIIDMQKGSFTEKTPRYDSEGVIERINHLSCAFRERKFPVIFVQHDGTGTGEFEKNSWEWELLNSLRVEPVDIFIDKYANDVFYRSSLQNKLTALGVSQLYITGCATDFCVESTIQSALTKDFEIFVISDGHTTGNRPELTAIQVINHYNWVWQNMIDTKGNLNVVECESVINSMIKVQ